jgi:hypothetical protein
LKRTYGPTGLSKWRTSKWRIENGKWRITPEAVIVVRGSLFVERGVYEFDFELAAKAKKGAYSNAPTIVTLYCAEPTINYEYKNI